MRVLSSMTPNTKKCINYVSVAVLLEAISVYKKIMPSGSLENKRNSTSCLNQRHFGEFTSIQISWMIHPSSPKHTHRERERTDDWVMCSSVSHVIWQDNYSFRLILSVIEWKGNWQERLGGQVRKQFFSFFQTIGIKVSRCQRIVITTGAEDLLY